MRNWARFGTPRLAATLGLVVIALVALASVVGFARAAKGPASAQYQYRVPVCHKGHTIVIAIAAQPAHLGHGDTAGPCP
jgi:hypothetical protein